MSNIDYNYHPMGKDDIKELEKTWKKYNKKQKHKTVIDYIITAYKMVGLLILFFVFTAIFSSPLIIGLGLGMTCNPYWFFMIFGLFITIPIMIAIIVWAVDKDILSDFLDI